jgi:hypothetical protein
MKSAILCSDDGYDILVNGVARTFRDRRGQRAALAHEQLMASYAIFLRCLKSQCFLPKYRTIRMIMFFAATAWTWGDAGEMLSQVFD